MNTVRLMAVGDISLQTNNNALPFAKVKGIFETKDILFGNLETVLSNYGKQAEKAVVLQASPSKAAYLKDAGFDVLNIANNHSLDLGLQGFRTTVAVLNKERISFAGINCKTHPKYTIIERGYNIKVGVLAYSQYGIHFPEIRAWLSGLRASSPLNIIDSKRITGDIRNIKSECDLVIVSLHWGVDNVCYPSPNQIQLAHQLIDAGATVILGHHSHVVQGIEEYNGGLIAYSLGNFQFFPNPSGYAGGNLKRTNRSIVLMVELSKHRLENWQVVPVDIDSDFVPIMSANGPEIIRFISEISQPLKDGTLSQNWWFEQIAADYLSDTMHSFNIQIRKYGIKHFMLFIIWLLLPFNLHCYAAIVKIWLNKLVGNV